MDDEDYDPDDFDLPWDKPSSNKLATPKKYKSYSKEDKPFTPNPLYYHTNVSPIMTDSMRVASGLYTTIYGMKLFFPNKAIKDEDGSIYVHTNTYHAIIGAAYIDFASMQKPQ